MAEPLRHRQTKEAATDLFSLQPPRPTATAPNPNSTTHGGVGNKEPAEASPKRGKDYLWKGKAPVTASRLF
jgi:hypothetical protein